MNIPQKIAKILPHKVVYYAIIRAFAYASTHECRSMTPDQIGFTKLIESWENKKRK